MTRPLLGALFTLAIIAADSAHAFFFIIPIPNIAKPPVLQKTIDALEKSEETKALAYVSEDKTFGSKYWVWGHFVGKTTQEEANHQALSKCQSSLANAKAQQVGGSTLYDFGNKSCELYEFENKTVARSVSDPQPAGPVTQTAPQTAATPLPTATPPAAPAAAPSPRPPDKAQSADGSTAAKLRELAQLLKEGLITQQEYDEKRKKLLDSL